jgi:hypothetical protein
MVEGWCDDERDTSGPVLASSKVTIDPKHDEHSNIFKEVYKHLDFKMKNTMYNEATYVEYEYESREKRADDYDILEADAHVEAEAEAEADAVEDAPPKDGVTNSELIEVVKYAYV